MTINPEPGRNEPMDSFLKQIIEGLKEVFPEAEGMTFTSESILAEVPDWDSMAAVNLQTYLQQQFEIEVPLELLADEATLDDLVNFIKNPVSQENV
jgi:acyl carrier protein